MVEFLLVLKFFIFTPIVSVNLWVFGGDVEAAPSVNKGVSGEGWGTVVRASPASVCVWGANKAP